MSWRKWWIKPLQQMTDEVEEKLEVDPGRQAGPRPPAADPVRLLERPASSGVHARALRWLGRVYGNRHVQRLLAQVRGIGRPLDANTRRSMESAFGEEFDDVRIHTGPEAEAAALELGAEAVTHGQDIYFGPERYDPESSEGRRLLAHELAHTVQQTGGTAPAGERRPGSDPERAAEQAADTVASGARLDFALASAEATPTMSPGPWGDDVRAAQRIADVTRRRDVMVALVQRALSGTSIRVHVAGSSSPAQVHPDDYRSAPVLNFDVNLKRSWPSRPGRGQNGRARDRD